MSYTFLDAASSVQSADSSVIAGTTIRQAVDVASVLSAIPVNFSGSPSISGAVTIVGTPSVSGAMQIAGASPASILTITRLDNQVIGSMQGTVGQVVIHGLTSAGGGSYVDVKVDPSGALVVSIPSVVAFQGGTQITSTISANPSSMLVGASIFGQLPAGTAPLGSVATLQGTNPWIINGSVSGTVGASIIGNVNDTITSIATANGGLPIWSPLASRIQGTADLRVVLGASVAAIPAQGAGVRAYIDHVQVVNYGSASVLVTIADNTTSILGYTIAPAGGGSNYDCFYRPAANSPITASINGTASVLVSMQGFTSST